ncbi:MAG TPA: hypothetical protein VFI28_03590 [Candidatus Limnocylindrales bacterium]|nr:hypothetical protein [Candidatus Limnocylindrales bacterium]
MAVQVERRDVVTVVVHGSLAGLVAGLILGTATVVGSLVLSGDASLPFRFAAAFVVGPAALGDQLSMAAAVLLGAAIHFSLAALFGIVFVGLLALTYQLSARWWLLVVYGAIFAFGVWEVDFMAAVPALFPFLVDRLDLPTQLWAGILSYALVYGPILGAYVAIVRPGVIGDWHAVGPPAGVFTGTTGNERD